MGDKVTRQQAYADARQWADRDGVTTYVWQNGMNTNWHWATIEPYEDAVKVGWELADTITPGVRQTKRAVIR